MRRIIRPARQVQASCSGAAPFGGSFCFLAFFFLLAAEELLEERSAGRFVVEGSELVGDPVEGFGVRFDDAVGFVEGCVDGVDFFLDGFLDVVLALVLLFEFVGEDLGGGEFVGADGLDVYGGDTRRPG